MLTRFVVLDAPWLRGKSQRIGLSKRITLLSGSMGEALELRCVHARQPILAVRADRRGSLRTSVSRKACTYARSWSIRALS